MDSRAARVLTEERRSMFDDEVWDWIVDHASGDFDHLLIATTVPYLLSPGFHHLEAWNERLCDGAWGGPPPAAARSCAAPSTSTTGPPSSSPSIAARAARRGRLGPARQGPGLDRAALRRRPPRLSLRRRLQARRGDEKRRLPGGLLALPQPARGEERKVVKAGFSPPSPRSPRLARLAGAPDPGIRWRLLEGPYFDNQVGTLRLDGRHAIARLDKTVAGEEDERKLEKTFERRLV